MSVRFRSWSRSSAVSPPLMTEAINLAVGCHYFPMAYGLSRRCDGSHHQERWVLLCENSPILDWHIRPQVEHRMVPGSGGSVLRSCRFATRWSTRFSSKRCTALRHVVRQVVLSLARLSRSDGVISHCLRVSFRRSLLSTRPAVTSPAAKHHRPLAVTKLYCLVTEALVCKQLAQNLSK